MSLGQGRPTPPTWTSRWIWTRRTWPGKTNCHLEELFPPLVVFPTPGLPFFCPSETARLIWRPFLGRCTHSFRYQNISTTEVILFSLDLGSGHPVHISCYQSNWLCALYERTSFQCRLRFNGMQGSHFLQGVSETLRQMTPPPDCFVLHDVDHIPERQGLMYR